jgi:hypothetical protein
MNIIKPLVLAALLVGVAGCATGLAPTMSLMRMTIYANDTSFPDALKKKYAGQRVRGRYLIRVDDHGAVKNIEVLHAIPDADDVVRSHFQRASFSTPDSDPAFIVPVELEFIAAEPTSSGAYRTLTSMELKDQLLGDEPQPKLPPATRDRYRGRTVTGMYMVYVELDGTISRVDVTRSIEGADDAIMATLKQWKLKPQPERIRAKLWFTFQDDH